MSTITIYHNPRCSKSRQTLQLLQDNGVEPTIINYIDNPPTIETLQALLKQLGISALELARKKETDFAQVTDSSDPKAILQAMTQYPKLIERPIVTNGHKAVLGRPPENALDLI